MSALHSFSRLSIALLLCAAAQGTFADHLKPGAFVEFAARDGVKKYGKIREVASKDCWIILPGGNARKLLTENITGCERTGERLDVKPISSYTKVRYPICRITLKDGKTVIGGFSSNLVIWIDDTDGGVHRKGIGDHQYIKLIPKLPTEDQARQTQMRTVTDRAGGDWEIMADSIYDFGWSSNSEKITFYPVTKVSIKGNAAELHYDWRNGVLHGTMDGRILSGEWVQSNARGEFHVEFASNFDFAAGWWNYSTEPTVRYPAYMRTRENTSSNQPTFELQEGDSE